MKYCQRCKELRPQKLRRIVARNGQGMISWYCLTGKHWAFNPVRWLSHEELRDVFARHNIEYDRESPGQIPTLDDYRAECQVCGELGAEWHHWFPTVILRRLTEEALLDFNDGWGSLGAYLCPEHHRQWHEAVTWYIPTFARTETAIDAKALWVMEGPWNAPSDGATEEPVIATPTKKQP